MQNSINEQRRSHCRRKKSNAFVSGFFRDKNTHIRLGCGKEKAARSFIQ
jgi:hypothetical protein